MLNAVNLETVHTHTCSFKQHIFKNKFKEQRPVLWSQVVVPKNIAKGLFALVKFYYRKTSAQSRRGLYILFLSLPHPRKCNSRCSNIFYGGRPGIAPKIKYITPAFGYLLLLFKAIDTIYLFLKHRVSDQTQRSEVRLEQPTYGRLRRPIYWMVATHKV